MAVLQDSGSSGDNKWQRGGKRSFKGMPCSRGTSDTNTFGLSKALRHGPGPGGRVDLWPLDMKAIMTFLSTSLYR